MNLILIGYRGTGKTSVARHLAARLGWPCVDSDVEIERAAGKSIASIFADELEEGFRNRESAVLEDLVAGDRRVLSVGGGAILRPHNRQLLAAAGRVVWLQATPETILRRLSADPATVGQRPNLTADGGLTEIQRVLGQREKVYRECANLVVDTEDKDPVEVAEEILAGLEL